MKSLDSIWSWYEVGLPPKERKRRGHFSTPSELVKQILNACGYSSEADLMGVRVLDPACGSGNFLAEAAHRLVAFSRGVGLDQEAQAILIQRNLWGFDPDPIACFLAEMQLYAVLDEGWRGLSLPCVGASAELAERVSIPSCPSPIYRPGDPIAWPHQYVNLHYRARQGGGGLHIHQADALALPWEPCADLFVANPPYLAAKNTDLSGYQSAQRGGQADSYLLFLRLALQALRPNGWMGLVLPDPLLARANAAKERADLLKEATIHHIWHLSGVFAAEVGAVVIIAKKSPPQHLHQVSWVRGKWRHKAESMASPMNQVPQALLYRQPGAEMRYLLSSGRGVSIERLRAHVDGVPGGPRRFAPLGEFLTISRGEELGKNSCYVTSFLERTSFRRGVFPNSLRDTDVYSPEIGHPYYPILLGGVDIRPYTIPTATYCIAREAIAKPLERYLSAKLLVVKSTDRLQATLDLQGHVALQTLYLLHPRTGDTGEEDLYFFLAILNSHLLREYVYMLHTAYKWVQPQIEQSVLARLPVPLVEADERQQIIKRARLLMDACSAGDSVVEWKQDIHRLYEEQERAICALYDTASPGLFTM